MNTHIIESKPRGNQLNYVDFENENCVPAYTVSYYFAIVEGEFELLVEISQQNFQ